MRRTNAVKLAVDGETNEKLRELGIITAKCWNEVNWLRMQQFKRGERVDFARTEKEAYGKHRHVLKVNAQQVARKNAENWRSFFSLIKAKKEGKLPKWFRPRPPGYWRDESGKYKLMIVIRNDRYEVYEDKRIIYLKDFNLTLRFK
ncbi:MAG: transposase, partial [Candidatus Methanoglobus sp.]